MLSKWKIELISFLASLSMISVGFSSWNISYTVPVIETIGGTIQTDYVLKTDDYVYFSKDDDKSTDDGVILPNFVKEGFVTQDDKGIYRLSNVGYLDLVFTVDYAKCNSNESALKKDTKIDIECNISLAANANKFFYAISAEEFSCSYDSWNLGFPIDATNPNGLNFSLVPVGNSVSLKIINYPFNQLAENTNGKIYFTLSFTLQQKSDAQYLDKNTFVFDTKVYSHS